MRVVVLASQKGGSGKTTLSGHLAVQAELAGAGPVALIDTDPQGSLAKWWNSRKSESPHFVKVGLPDLSGALAHLQKCGFKMVVIDTPPAISSSISHVVAYSDLVIIPARPSPHDLRAVGPTADIVERLNTPMIFVINGATRRAHITGEAAVALSQHGTVAPVTYVQDRLSRLMRDPSMMPEVRADHLAISALTRLDQPLPEEAAESEEPVVEQTTSHAEISHRHVAAIRRTPFGAPLGGAERRSHAFGRRVTDHQTNGQGH